MAEESFQEKTESATPRRREDARKKGQVARSMELNSFAVLFAGTLFLLFLAPGLTRDLSALMRHFLGSLAASPGTDADYTALLRAMGWRTLVILAPLFAVLVAVGIASNAGQVGFKASVESLQPRFSKLNVVSGLKRLFSRRSLFELVRDVLKLTMIGTIAYFAVEAERGSFVALVDMDVAAILAFTGGALFRVGLKIILGLFVLAAIDYAFQRWDFERSLRMTKQEIKEEHRQSEGSPLMRSRIRQVQRDLARMRMAREVPKADVVITNPTELAVAIRYDVETMSAPTVVAKGARLLAQKIREIAVASGVPLVENKPLARALYSSVEIGSQVPADLYRATAEVLAYAYRWKGSGSAQPVEEAAS